MNTNENEGKNMENKWHVMMTEEEAKPYREKIDQIKDALLHCKWEAKDSINLMGGKAGVALFFFYYSLMTKEEKYQDVGIEMLSEIFDEINNGFIYHTHAGGLAGIGWTVELLSQNEFLEIDTNETLGDIDPYLHKTMIHDITHDNYDFLHGAVGNGNYFLSRAKNAAVNDYLSELLDKLEENSIKDEDGARKWLSTLDQESGLKGYNVSLSHGISSIIAFLGKMVAHGVQTEKASLLLSGAVQFLLAHRLDRTKFVSIFPSWVQLDGELSDSRLAWCYGDLGISMALWQAGKNVGNKEWQKIAEDTLVDAATRRDVKEHRVMDAGLCHGAAGIMHIFNRAYQNTGLEILKETARYWAEQTLKMAHWEDGYAGYKSWHTEKYGGWKPEPGFLEGVAGIGLALISMIAPIESKWDESLYIS